MTHLFFFFSHKKFKLNFDFVTIESLTLDTNSVTFPSFVQKSKSLAQRGGYAPFFLFPSSFSLLYLPIPNPLHKPNPSLTFPFSLHFLTSPAKPTILIQISPSGVSLNLHLNHKNSIFKHGWFNIRV